MTHAVAKDNAEELAAKDLGAPCPPERRCFATNHIAANRSSLKSWMRNKFGAGGPKAAYWTLYIRELQRAQWFRGTYVPLLIDTIRRAAAESWGGDPERRACRKGFLLVRAAGHTINSELRVDRLRYL